MEIKTTRELSEFHALFAPFAMTVYRSALIASGTHRCAEKLQSEIYMRAFVEFVNAGKIYSFKDWLGGIVHENLDRFQRRESESNDLQQLCA